MAWSMDSTTSKWQVPDRSSLRTVHPESPCELGELELGTGHEYLSASLRDRLDALYGGGYRRSLSSTHHTAAGVVAKASFHHQIAPVQVAGDRIERSYGLSTRGRWSPSRSALAGPEEIPG